MLIRIRAAWRVTGLLTIVGLAGCGSSGSGESDGGQAGHEETGGTSATGGAGATGGTSATGGAGTSSAGSGVDAGGANGGFAGASGGTSDEAGTTAGGTGGTGGSELGEAGVGGVLGGTGGVSGHAGSGGSGGTLGVGGHAGAAGSGGAAGHAGGGASGAGGAAGHGGGGTGGTAGTGGIGVSVLTRSYDNQRTNANLLETTLTVANVNAASFGKIFDLPVDDDVYAQVLYAPKSLVAPGTHDVIYVATVNNTVYAFDANAAGAPLWVKNFNGTGRPSNHTDVGQACGVYNDYAGNIGIVATPVIDAVTRTMYFVTRTIEGGITVQRLHAVDIGTGVDKPKSPIVLGGTAPTKLGGAVTFDPVVQNQRMSLSLSNGVVYMGWSSFCDTGTYHGWLMAYDAATLAQLGVFNDTPDGNQGGIWQAGAAAAFDPAGNLYLLTGNGSFDGITNFAQSFVKLAPKTLTLLDYFTPANYGTLNAYDWDLGSAGPTWLPGYNLLVGGGKEGKLYVVNPANMGLEVAGDTQVLQSFQAVDPTARPDATHHIHNALAAWASPAGLNVYLSGENDYLRSFRFDGATHQLDVPANAVSNVLPPMGMPGGMLTVSANGSKAGTGIVWSTTPRLGDANQAIVPGILRAYDAENLALLWESTRPADGVLNFAKFSNPTVVNGKVYAASFSHLVTVYGLRLTPPVNLALNKVTSGSAACAATEGPENAVNGSVILGNGDKWCSLAATKFLQVDLGANVSVSRVVVRHANAGGEPFALNTRDFTIQASVDGVTYSTVANVTGNDASVTTHVFPAATERYVRLEVTTPSQTGDQAARIYELEVYAQ